MSKGWKFLHSITLKPSWYQIKYLFPSTFFVLEIVNLNLDLRGNSISSIQLPVNWTFSMSFRSSKNRENLLILIKSNKKGCRAQFRLQNFLINFSWFSNLLNWLLSNTRRSNIAMHPEPSESNPLVLGVWYSHAFNKPYQSR